MTRTIMLAVILCVIASAAVLSGLAAADADRTTALAVIWAAGAAIVARRLILSRARRRR